MARGETVASPETLPGFDFCLAMRRLCAALIDGLPELHHIDLQRVAIAIAKTRKAVPHGLYASLTPLRFEQGSTTTVEGGQRYVIQRVLDGRGREMLYILTFYLPRFMEVDLLEKLVTVLHELWHISPAFDGDLRRHAGRCYAHTHSQREYDARMETLARRWLALDPPEDRYSFLKLSFQQLQRTFGSVHGARIRRPRLLPV